MGELWPRTRGGGYGLGRHHESEMDLAMFISKVFESGSGRGRDSRDSSGNKLGGLPDLANKISICCSVKMKKHVKYPNKQTNSVKYL